MAGAIGATVVALPTVAGAVPQQTPDRSLTIAQVQKQLGDLALQNSQLIEQFDQARIAVSDRRADAQTAQDKAAALAQRLDASRRVLGRSFAAMYEGGSFSATGALLSSKDGASYLDSLDMLSMVTEHNDQLVRDVTAMKKVATDARDHAKALLADAQAKLDELATQKKHVQAQVDKYKDLLATLTAAQRAAYFAAANRTVTTQAVDTVTTRLKTVKGTPAAARKAVEFALAQVGKPYVWGSAGPSTYDCSGLTMAAYASAGISLPHSSYQQYDYGTHVSSQSELKPGDLIFLYNPISHVEIYIGDGLAVSAPTAGENVKVVSIGGGDYTGATRLVG